MKSSDGVGILTQIPYTFFKKSVKDFQLPKEGHYGVGQFFFPMNELERHQAMTMFEKDYY